MTRITKHSRKKWCLMCVYVIAALTS